MLRWQKFDIVQISIHFTANFLFGTLVLLIFNKHVDHGFLKGIGADHILLLQFLRLFRIRPENLGNFGPTFGGLGLRVHVFKMVHIGHAAVLLGQREARIPKSVQGENIVSVKSVATVTPRAVGFIVTFGSRILVILGPVGRVHTRLHTHEIALKKHASRLGHVHKTAQITTFLGRITGTLLRTLLVNGDRRLDFLGFLRPLGAAHGPQKVIPAAHPKLIRPTTIIKKFIEILQISWRLLFFLLIFNQPSFNFRHVDSQIQFLFQGLVLLVVKSDSEASILVI